MIPIQRSGLSLRHAPGWVQQQGLDVLQLRNALGREVPWEQPLVRVYGRQHPTPRLCCWVADPGCSYRYSGHQSPIHPWTPNLSALRELLHEQLGVRFNSLLLNRYRNGADRMGWHADDEPELGREPLIVSVSLGASRAFQLRRRDDPSVRRELHLHHGDVVVMHGLTQALWLHQVPKTSRYVGPRVNLTFRTIRRR